VEGALQRDYILRLIEQIGAVLIALRKRILARSIAPEEARDALRDVGSRAGFDLDLLRGFSLESLVLFVAPTGEVEPSRCWMMAEVLYLDGLQASVEERMLDARESLAKAAALYGLVEPGGGMLVGFPEAATRIAEIEALLEDLPGG
jgi:hypothetical protein